MPQQDDSTNRQDPQQQVFDARKQYARDLVFCVLILDRQVPETDTFLGQSLGMFLLRSARSLNELRNDQVGLDTLAEIESSLVVINNSYREHAQLDATPQGIIQVPAEDGSQSSTSTEASLLSGSGGGRFHANNADLLPPHRPPPTSSLASGGTASLTTHGSSGSGSRSRLGRQTLPGTEFDPPLTTAHLMLLIFHHLRKIKR